MVRTTLGLQSRHNPTSPPAQDHILRGNPLPEFGNNLQFSARISTIMASNGNEEKVVINTDIVTLTRFLTEEQAKHKEATGDFTYALSCHVQKLRANSSPGSSAMLSNSPSSPLRTIFVEQLSSTLPVSPALPI